MHPAGVNCGGSPAAPRRAGDLPPWRPLLSAERAREGRSPSSRWVQLATVGGDGTPRVRTLVFRGWAGPRELDLLSDGRSAKAAELLRQPAVELCWLLPRARSQFRLRGRCEPPPADGWGPERLRHWRSLPPAARALWGWPEPGAPLEAGAAFPPELPEETPLPDHFLLLRIELEQVELLELRPHPHRRRRWRLATGWREESLHP